MNENNLIETARQKAKSGDLQTAKAILEALDSPRARNLLNKVNHAIASEKQKALSNRADAPKEKSKAKPKSSSTGLKVALVFGIAFGALIAGYFVWQNFASTMNEVNAEIDTLLRDTALSRLCDQEFVSEFVERDISTEDSDAACAAEIQWLIDNHGATVDLCLEQSNSGVDSDAFAGCLIAEDVEFSGEFVEDAGRADMPNSR